MKKIILLFLLSVNFSYSYAQAHEANEPCCADSNLIMQLVDSKLANFNDKLTRIEQNTNSSIAELKADTNEKLSDKFKQLDDRSSSIDTWLSFIGIVLTVLGIFAPIFGYVLNRTVNAKLKDSEDELKEFQKAIKETITEKLEYSDRIIKLIEDNHKRSVEYTAQQKEIIEGIIKEDSNKDKEQIEEIAKITTNKSENALTAEEWFIRGLDAQNRELYYDAITYYSKSIDLDEKQPSPYNNRGLAKDSLGKYYDAIEDYNKAIELNPNNVNAYNNRGISKANLSNYNDAIEDFNKAIVLNPEYTNAYYNKSCVYAAMKNKDVALNTLDEALSLGYSVSKTLTDKDWEEYLEDSEFKALIAKYNNKIEQ